MSTPNETSSNVTTLPRGGRDGFIADTAVRIDRMEAALAVLQRDADLTRNAIEALMDSAEQTRRLRTFEESLRNSREYKIDEIVRSSRELKTRVDRAEGDKAAFGALEHNTWEAVNNRLRELGTLSVQVQASEKRVKTNGYFFYATLLVLASTLAAYGLPALSFI